MKYLRYLISCLALVTANYAEDDDDGVVDKAQVRPPGTQPPKFSLRPLPNPMPPPGFAIEKYLDPEMDKKDNPMCGPDIGSCSEGLCCSMQGYCGSGPEYCSAPDCLLEYGIGCDAHKRPVGHDTLDISRKHIGEVPYGYTPIYQCVVPNTVALTYDDGPHIYTKDLLDILDFFEAKATFFISGINSNKGQIDDPKYPWLKMIQRMYASGHQIASHTWSHQNLDDISSVYRRDQMVKNEMALRNILGGFPTYMRPPYSSCSIQSGCLDDMDDLGYHVSYFNVDTDDYNNDDPEYIQHSKYHFDNALAMHESTGRPMLVIAHDVHEQTVYNLTAHMLRRLADSEYRTVTLGECLGDPVENWYRWADGTGRKEDESEPPEEKKPATKTVSPDGTCGTQFTCSESKFGDCCSANGFCGNATSHCVKGCQKSAGICFQEEDRLLDKPGKLSGKNSKGLGDDTDDEDYEDSKENEGDEE